MVKAKSKTTSTKPTQECTCCGKAKKVSSANFYKSYSVMYKSTYENRMTVCKECVLKLVDEFKATFNSELKVLYSLCRMLDVLYDEYIYNVAKEQAAARDGNPYQYYFQKVLSLPQFANKTFADSAQAEIGVGEVQSSEASTIAEDNGINIDHTTRIKWGNLPNEDLMFLEYNYNQWVTRHQCETRAEELLFEEICHVQLDINKLRMSGGDTTKKVDQLQKLMQSANIRPLDQTAITSNENVMMWGTTVATIEKHEPCEFFGEYREKEYKDYMGYRGYFDNWVLRGLKNLLAGTKDFNIVLEEEEVKDGN